MNLLLLLVLPLLVCNALVPVALDRPELTVISLPTTIAAGAWWAGAVVRTRSTEK